MNYLWDPRRGQRELHLLTWKMRVVISLLLHFFLEIVNEKDVLHFTEIINVGVLGQELAQSKCPV